MRKSEVIWTPQAEGGSSGCNEPNGYLSDARGANRGHLDTHELEEGHPDDSDSEQVIDKWHNGSAAHREAGVLSDIIRVVKDTNRVVSRIVSAGNLAAMHSISDIVDGECSQREGIMSIRGGDGCTLEKALFGVEKELDGGVFVDAEALNVIDTDYVRSVTTGAEEEEEE
ncbi:hypothetical protein BGX38DRAFT_1275345 [Terfezia claveryi]|nr:hypothetical protein BGX38DRAFT_1275345 [Terfezia claveryi]